ncbi:MAG: secretin N-terminal domain-containing protein, partial [Verrucomicrobiaceae bacterium]
RSSPPPAPVEGAPAPSAPAPGGPAGGPGVPVGPGGSFGGGRRGFGGGFGPGGAAPAEDTTMTITGDQVALNFPNNAVSDLLAVYEKLTGMTLVKDTAIFDGAPISLVTPKPVAKEEAVRLIEATLLTNGYAIILNPDGKSARILPTRTQGASSLQFSQGVRFYLDAKELPEGETLVTYFMKLDHLTPEEAGAILANHVGLNVYGRITPVTTPPGLLITESATIVRQLISIREAIDATETTSSLITKFVKLEYADAATVAQIVQATLDAQAQDQQTKGISTIRGQAGPESGRRSGDERNNNGGDNRQPPPPSPSSSNNNSSASSKVDIAVQPTSQVVADPRLNQVLIVATPEDFAYITSLIQEFDKPVEVAEPFERKLNYAYAVDVLSALVDLLTDTATGTTSQLPGGGTLNTGGQRPTTSSSSQLLTGRNTTNSRGAQLATSTGSGSDTGTSTSSTSSAGSRADQLIAPQEDNAPISVLVNKTRVIADPMSNTIIVMGSKEAIDRVTLLLDRLDRKPAQVYLATVIGQLTLGDGSELGVDWLTKYSKTGSSSGVTGSFFQKRSDVITNNNISDLRDNLITSAFGPAAGFNLYGQISDTVDAYVTALETTNRFKVISRPSVFALNNKKATITSGQLVPVPEQSITAAGNNGNGTVTTTVDFKDVVLKLEVVPLINPNGEVTLTIAQVNDNIVGTQRVEPNDIPIISTQQVITTVTVQDGHTVVLGGLISEQDKKDTGGVPGISRIPVLGSLFKNNTKSKSRSELIIFIQPHVVNDNLQLSNASNNEDIRTSIGAEAAEKFPTDASLLPPIGVPEKKKNWFQRNFGERKDGSKPAPQVIPSKSKF